MSVMRASVVWAAVTTVAALALAGGGCVKQRPTMSKPPPAENRGNGGRRTEFQPQELDRKAGQFAELARRLPASSAQQDRAMMRQPRRGRGG